jgi:hypothetical protein
MSPREVELEQLLRWAVAETGPVPVDMGAPNSEPFPLRYPDWAEDARQLLAGAPRMQIGEACEVLERACTPGRVDLLDLLGRMHDNPGAFSARERAAWRSFVRDGTRMFAPQAAA